MLLGAALLGAVPLGAVPLGVVPLGVALLGAAPSCKGLPEALALVVLGFSSFLLVSLAMINNPNEIPAIPAPTIKGRSKIVFDKSLISVVILIVNARLSVGMGKLELCKLAIALFDIMAGKT